MSYRAPSCPRCNHPTHFRNVGDIGLPETFTVLWACDRCFCSGVAEVYGLWGATPEPGFCLGCGEWVVPRLDMCHVCDLVQASTVAEIHARCGAPPEANRILSLCDEGLFMLALCATNLLLLEDPEDAMALRVKGTILSRLGHDELAEPLLRQAQVLAGDGDDTATVEGGDVEAGLRWNLVVKLCHEKNNYTTALVTGGVRVGENPVLDMLDCKLYNRLEVVIGVPMLSTVAASAGPAGSRDQDPE